MTERDYADGGRLPSERQYRDDCPKCKTRDVPMTRHEGATVGLTCGNCGKTWDAPGLDEAQDHTPERAYGVNPNPKAISFEQLADDHDLDTPRHAIRRIAIKIVRASDMVLKD